MASAALIGSKVSGKGGYRSKDTQRDDAAEPAAAQDVEYRCANNHTQTLRFSAFADEIPDTWECRSCSKPGRRVGLSPVAEEPGLDEPAYEGAWYSRRHLHTAKSRRTPEEQEALLAERLAFLRGRSQRLAS